MRTTITIYTMRAAYDIMVGYTAIRIFMHAGGGNVSSNQSGCRIASHLEVKYFKLKPPLWPDLLPARLLPCLLLCRAARGPCRLARRGTVDLSCVRAHDRPEAAQADAARRVIFTCSYPPDEWSGQQWRRSKKQRKRNMLWRLETDNAEK